MTRDILIFYRAVVFLFCGAMNYDEKTANNKLFFETVTLRMWTQHI